MFSSKSGGNIQVFQQGEIDYIGLIDAISNFSTVFGSSQSEYNVVHFVHWDGSVFKRYKFMGSTEEQI